jgi:hypothetical protein
MAGLPGALAEGLQDGTIRAIGRLVDIDMVLWSTLLAAVLLGSWFYVLANSPEVSPLTRRDKLLVTPV